jgi:hypothetical protein
VSAAHSTGLLRVWALDAFPFAGGAAMGMVGWSTLLLWMLTRFRTRVSPSSLDRIIRVGGAFLLVLGIGLLVRTALEWS